MRVLVPVFVYIKRGIEELSKDNDPTEEEEEAAEEMDDIAETQSRIKELLGKGVAERVDRGLPVPVKDFKSLQEIKEEYASYFDEESGNDTVSDALKEVDVYLEEEFGKLSVSNPPKSDDQDESEDAFKPKRKRTEDYETTEESGPSKSVDKDPESGPSKSVDKDPESESSSGNKSPKEYEDIADSLPAEMPSFLDDFD